VLKILIKNGKNVYLQIEMANMPPKYRLKQQNTKYYDAT
jgi:hypothetical protein